MENLKQLISSINLNDLLKLFDIQIAIAILLFFILFRKVFSRVLIKIYYKIIKSKKNPKDSSMYRPLNIMFILIGIYCMIKILPTSPTMLLVMNKIYKLVIIYYVFKIVTNFISTDSIFLKKFFKDPTNKTVNMFLCTITKFVIWMIYIFIVFAETGYAEDLSGLFTALGFASAAVALAAQELVKSLISGVTILTDKPFVIGDWIEVDQYQGTVIDITFRSVRIKSFNNSVVTIPNSVITSSYVVNWNRLTSRRFECVLNLSLETPSEKIKKIVKEIKVVLENDPKVIKETIQVSLIDITACSNDIKIVLFLRESEYAKFLKAKQDVLCSLLFLVEKENIDLAYPTQTLYVKRNGDEEA